MHKAFGPLVLTLKYTYTAPSGTIYLQLPVPVDLRARYGGRETIKQSLKTREITRAAPMVEALRKQYQAEWDGLRAAPESSPKALAAHAVELLRGYGLTPGSQSADALELEHPGLSAFSDRLEGKLERHAGNDRETYDNAEPADYLSPVEAVAFNLYKGTQTTTPHKPTLSDALELYISIHPKRDNPKFITAQRRFFGTLIAAGDKPFNEFTRQDARAYLDASLLTAKTTTVRRRLNVISAVFATYIRENNLQTPNPFASLPIPKQGHDAVKRVSFTPEELQALIAACKAQDDPMRWILLMLAGTGARLAEVVGLPLADINTDAAIPHVIIQVHPWRDIKGADGLRGVKDRTVPLVGPALWAAHRIKAWAAEFTTPQRFAFPRYTTAERCNADTASAALNKWVRAQGLPHTCHELRHTLKGNLRDVQAPKDISDAITGHGTPDIGDRYGRGYGHSSLLHVTHGWLVKALDATALEALGSHTSA